LGHLTKNYESVAKDSTTIKKMKPLFGKVINNGTNDFVDKLIAQIRTPLAQPYP